MTAKITLYDYWNLNYIGFYIKGFQENARKRGYRLSFSHGQPPELTGLNLREAWSFTKKFGMYLVGRYEKGEESFLFTIDTSDLHGSLTPPIEDYVDPLLEVSKYYFKVNYNKEAIANNPRLAPHQEKIFPLPIVFPVAVAQPWRVLPKMTPLGGPAWTRESIKGRFSSFLTIPSLADYRRMRAMPKDIDVFFISTLRSEAGRPHYTELNNRRRAVIEGLNDYSRFNIMARYLDLDGDIGGPLAIPKLELDKYLELMARSRIGIYVRGSFDCLSFKFGELMALGGAIVGETILNNREMMYSFDRFGEQFAYDDPESLVERVGYLLEHPSLIDEYARANQETFDNHLSPGPVVSAILDRLM